MWAQTKHDIAFPLLEEAVLLFLCKKKALPALPRLQLTKGFSRDLSDYSLPYLLSYITVSLHKVWILSVELLALSIISIPSYFLLLGNINPPAMAVFPQFLSSCLFFPADQKCFPLCAVH